MIIESILNSRSEKALCYCHCAIYNNISYSIYLIVGSFITFKIYLFQNSKPTIKVIKLIDSFLLCHITFLLRILVNSSFTDNILSKKVIIIELFRNRILNKMRQLDYYNYSVATIKLLDEHE